MSRMGVSRAGPDVRRTSRILPCPLSENRRGGFAELVSLGNGRPAGREQPLGVDGGAGPAGPLACCFPGRPGYEVLQYCHTYPAAAGGFRLRAVAGRRARGRQVRTC